MAEPTGKERSSIRSAVIGYGGMAKGHVEWMTAVGFSVIAACDTDQARMEAAKTDFAHLRVYASTEELLRDAEVDLCVIVLPHHLHAEAAIACAKAGKHAIVEKPMCTSVADADAMIEAANEAGTMLSVFHNRRHDGDYLAIKQLIDEGTIGEVFHIECSMGQFGHPGLTWRAHRATSGGAMYDWGAHLIDWILQLVPKPVVGVNGYQHKLVWHDYTNEDDSHLTIRFDGGAIADVQMSQIDAAPKPRWRILGTQGAIVENRWDKIQVTVNHDGYLAHFEVDHKKSSWSAYYDGIAEHLLHGADLEVKPEQARRGISILGAADRSATSGQTEFVEYP